ncbi:MAG: M1 family metallopeptidase [Clostridia bacterium]|nr:M1 family metallopeptidase [Clostridia bacterium]
MHVRCIIRKRWQKIALVACLLPLALLCFLWLRPGKAAGERARNASEGLDHYDYQLIFRPEESTLAVTMTLDFTNRTGDTLDTLVLRTWANAYEAEESSPAAIDALFDACYPEGFSAGYLTLEGAWWQGQVASAAYLDEAKTALAVSIDPLPSGQSGQMTLRCRITVPVCAHRLGFSKGIWQFGNALPILSVYENGGWRTDAYSPIGDPFVSQCANYAVSLTVPAGYQCASTGKCALDSREKDSWRYVIDAPAARDFAFALSQDWQKAETKQSGVSVIVCALENAGTAAKYAAKALKVYEKLYGDYPYETLTVCAIDFPFGGMEYPGLIFVGLPYFAAEQKDTLELVIAHEVAHQWFYGLVGSDQVNQPWQDEALSEYAMLRYARQVYGQNAYENLVITRVKAPMQERIPQPVTPATPITDFGSPDVYFSVVYGRGAAFLLAVEEMTGRLDAFLRQYCDTCAFFLASRQDFVKLLREVTGEDLEPLMLDYLDTLM